MKNSEFLNYIAHKIDRQIIDLSLVAFTHHEVMKLRQLSMNLADIERSFELTDVGSTKVTL